jgi:hypothetical protein
LHSKIKEIISRFLNQLLKRANSGKMQQQRKRLMQKLRDWLKKKQEKMQMQLSTNR